MSPPAPRASTPGPALFWDFGVGIWGICGGGGLVFAFLVFLWLGVQSGKGGGWRKFWGGG